MKTATTVLIIAAIGAVGAGSYWLGTQTRSAALSSAEASQGSPSAAVPKQRKLLYYRNPMGLADTSPVPKKDPMGMDYIPVYEGEDEASPGAGAGGWAGGRLFQGADAFQRVVRPPRRCLPGNAWGRAQAARKDQRPAGRLPGVVVSGFRHPQTLSRRWPARRRRGAASVVV